MNELCDFCQEELFGVMTITKEGYCLCEHCYLQDQFKVDFKEEELDE